MLRWTALLAVCVGTWVGWGASASFAQPVPAPTPAVDDREDEGRVTLPLGLWQRLADELRVTEAVRRLPKTPYAALSRSLAGAFRRGLLSATLDVHFEVFADEGYVTVPVLGAAASLETVLVNGEPGTLRSDGSSYLLGVSRPGRYHVQVRFYLGETQDRFARQLRIELPPAGPTRFALHVQERDIEPRLGHGVLTAQRPDGDGTAVEGHLDATGVLDLSWTRRLTHREAGDARTECVTNALFTVREAMVSGIAAFDIAVLEGETDRFDLRLPSGVEVVKVAGSALLQWHTDEDEDGARLSLLLRHLVSDRIDATVHFQYPVTVGAPVPLQLPLPPADVPLTGAAGVQAPTGLDVQVAAAGKATPVDLRELPPELTRLTPSPLLHGFRFTEAPATLLTVARHREVALTDTIVDELECSTMLLEDGAEVTKLRLHVRNNARQYLGLRLPEGAVLTHSLVDGHPVRPARVGEGAEAGLLLPLRQSEKLAPGEDRFHLVRPGETLGDIAYLYYSNPHLWRRILEANDDQMSNDADVFVGMSLRIPTDPGVTHEESRFVIELAYQLAHAPLGDWGSAHVGLPEIDVDVMKVLWHLYLPGALVPLHFDGNLTQYSAVRYDLFRRARDYLERVFRPASVYAGGSYRSILDQRKGIYHAEADKRQTGSAALASFPLVGERYRFKRILAGRDAPEVTVWYLASWLAELARWAALAMAFALTWLALARRRWWVWGLAAVGAAGLLVAAHYILGVHRRLLWGADLALLVAVVRLWGGPVWGGLKRRLRAPWELFQGLAWRHLVPLVGALALLRFLLRFPPLLAFGALVGLFIAWRQGLRLARQEESHA